MNLNITSNFKTMNLDEEKKVNNKTQFDRNRVGLNWMLKLKLN